MALFAPLTVWHTVAMVSYTLGRSQTIRFPVRDRQFRRYIQERSQSTCARATGSAFQGLRQSRSTLDMFQNYDWPGNIRELQNVIERAVILCETAVLYVDETWFRCESPSRPGKPIPFNAALTISEREMIERALSESAGRVGGPKGAAAKLGLPRQTVESKIKVLGINKFRYRHP